MNAVNHYKNWIAELKGKVQQSHSHIENFYKFYSAHPKFEQVAQILETSETPIFQQVVGISQTAENQYDKKFQ